MGATNLELKPSDNVSIRVSLKVSRACQKREIIEHKHHFSQKANQPLGKKFAMGRPGPTT